LDCITVLIAVAKRTIVRAIIVVRRADASSISTNVIGAGHAIVAILIVSAAAVFIAVDTVFGSFANTVSATIRRNVFIDTREPITCTSRIAATTTSATAEAVAWLATLAAVAVYIATHAVFFGLTETVATNCIAGDTVD
jgi:hypothetical protein